MRRGGGDCDKNEKLMHREKEEKKKKLGKTL